MTGGCAAMMLFLFFYSQQHAIDGADIALSPLIFLLICGIMLMISGVMGLLTKSRRVLFVTVLLSAAALVVSFIFGNSYIVFIALGVLLAFQLAVNLCKQGGPRVSDRKQ